jgi:hypothetical protein
MQHGSYSQLSSIWKSRKAELKAKIDQNMGQANKQKAAKAAKERPVLDEKQLAKIAAERKRRRDEKRRQATLNAEMAAEELRCRAFYKWELVENLRERRAMREEDMESKIMRSEEKKQLAQMQSSYNVGGMGGGHAGLGLGGGAAGGGTGGYQPFSDAERRRQQLKDIALERRRKVLLTRSSSYQLHRPRLTTVRAVFVGDYYRKRTRLACCWKTRQARHCGRSTAWSDRRSSSSRSSASRRRARYLTPLRAATVLAATAWEGAGRRPRTSARPWRCPSG